MSMQFFKDMLERAIKTFAQTLLASLMTASVLTDVDWGFAMSAAVLAALISCLTSIVSAEFGSSDSASLVDKKGKK